MDKDDASGADSGNDVAPVVADLLTGPSAKLSDTEIDGVGAVVVQACGMKPALACTSTVARCGGGDGPTRLAVAEGGGPGGRLQRLVDGSG